MNKLLLVNVNDWSVLIFLVEILTVKVDLIMKCWWIYSGKRRILAASEFSESFYYYCGTPRTQTRECDIRKVIFAVCVYEHKCVIRDVLFARRCSWTRSIAATPFENSRILRIKCLSGRLNLCLCLCAPPERVSMHTAECDIRSLAFPAKEARGLSSPDSSRMQIKTN